MKLGAFLLRYLRRHVGWLVLAGVAAIAYAATTVSLIGLIEPVFSEVLMADSGALAAFAPGLGDEEGEESASLGRSGIIPDQQFRDYRLIETEAGVKQ